MRFELFHGIQHHTNHDDQAHAGELQINAGKYLEKERHDGDYAKKESACPGDMAYHIIQILLGLRTRPNTGDKTTLLLEISRQVLLLKDNIGIKESETNGQQENKAPNR